MNVGSLFSGIGGIDLGLERAGMTVVWQSEIDPYACRVLAKHWPDVPNLGDITTVDWSSVEPPDLVCGGYPCQPFSLAGVRQGETDARHLWPHFADCLRHLRPRFALLENVPGHLSLGFGRVLGDLADLGYDCEWDCIPAAAVGAPHLRYRIFVVASSSDADSRGCEFDAEPHRDMGTNRLRRWPDPDGLRNNVPDAGRDVVRLQPVGVGRGSGATVARHDGADRDVADTESHRPFEIRSRGRSRTDKSRAAPGRTDGSHTWTTEPDVGRVAHGVPDRVDRLRCLGNAVVPQVAELIGAAIIRLGLED